MNDKINIKLNYFNESFIQIGTTEDVALWIADSFKFEVANARFQPKVKAGIWDGFIRLFDVRKRLLPIGLYNSLVGMLTDDGNFNIIIDDDIKKSKVGIEISTEEIIQFTEKLKTPFPPRDFQLSAISDMLFNKKQISEISTGAGKSFVIFIIFEILRLRNPKRKQLLIVPNVMLVQQIYANFLEYTQNYGKLGDGNYASLIQCISAGKDKDISKPITISTWQSLQYLNNSYFKQFDTLIIDECHKAKADKLVKIASSCINADFKFGTTGSLNNTITDRMQLKSLLSDNFRYTETKELIDAGLLSTFNINVAVLKYCEREKRNLTQFTKDYIESSKKKLATLKYNAEVEFINLHTKRKYIICKTALTRENNTLVLFKTIKYGKELLKILEAKAEEFGKEIYYIDGSVKSSIREDIRLMAENKKNMVIVATYSTFSTGVNIKNLHNLLFSENVKSLITVLQSIGRVLRKFGNKTAILWDFIDDLSKETKKGKEIKNYTLKHGLERVNIYTKQGFNYKVKEFKI